ncbi:hypothetical protein [Dickeya zeae]|uniref:Uncharacterized protein n=1 Tax=Dickeya zeae TaxID=204042 RepID=A0AAE6Z2D6_9GAMM|nr:hypothetical protein [Dickeya zeae]MCO7260722.1 hypothetical protein [Dickeya zeae]QIZ52135.1 hypothetical protein DWG24_15960 [Dickeya zeae]QYM91992.1 hypothetical protein FGI21_08955 [Dickeya zeae]
MDSQSSAYSENSAYRAVGTAGIRIDPSVSANDDNGASTKGIRHEHDQPVAYGSNFNLASKRAQSQ